jgi:hypothetical protein
MSKKQNFQAVAKREQPELHISGLAFHSALPVEKMTMDAPVETRSSSELRVNRL